MTLSILAHEPDTGAIGGAATTGNLCVGAWVLRGDRRAGMTASQGTAPSVLWGEEALAAMKAGASAEEAVGSTVKADAGAPARQLAALDRGGGTGAYDGADNHAWCGHLALPGLIVAGNWLHSAAVVQAAADGFTATQGPLAEKLLAALRAGAEAGGDARGLMSAALQVHSPGAAPLDLRVDDSPEPLASLSALYQRTRMPAYGAWLATVPTLEEPQRCR